MLTLSNEGIKDAVKFENSKPVGSSEEDEQFLERNSSSDTKKDPYNSMANSLVNSQQLRLTHTSQRDSLQAAERQLNQIDMTSNEFEGEHEKFGDQKFH